MFFLTLCFTSAVSAVKHVNGERIRLNEEVKLCAVVLDTLGIAVPQEGPWKEAVLSAFNERVRVLDVAGRSVYVGYDESVREVIGYAFAAAGPGFWGRIESMVAVDAGVTKIVGVSFPRHSETPGLGARMTEPQFRDQFRDLPLAAKDGEGRYFRLVTPGAAAGPGDLDAITGATETSRAIEGFLNRELALFVAAAAKDLGGGE
jgi:Na+-transporting NADH:ubiquinone oxidoreductase subunit C